MNYEFSLNKKTIVSLLAGWAVIGVLLFAAGWIIGQQWPVNSSTSTHAAKTEDEQAALPKEPVLNDEAAAPKAEPSKKSAPAKEPTATAPEAGGTTSVPPPAPQSAETTPAEEKVETTPQDSAAAPDNESDEEYVTVQVGVFLDEKDASRLLKQMERKGYAPTFFSGRDAEARQWYAVRIGAYSDKQQAANAAANFTKQEKMKAVVRPLGSL